MRTAFSDALTPLYVHPPEAPAAPVQILDPAPQGNWLEFETPSNILAETDLVNAKWVGKSPAACSRNVSTAEHPFMHPYFAFTKKVRGVRLQLRDLGPKSDGEPIWDVVFGGRPGNDYEVPNHAPPIGGMQPLFREFCPPLGPDSLYELRITEKVPKGSIALPSFDEVLRLRPARGVPKHWTGIPPPRPAYKGSSELAGPVGDLMDLGSDYPVTVASFL